IKFLTSAEEAEIGRGFKPCTRFSREYRFPTEEAPLLVFLDTRGLEEPGYNPDEDIAHFSGQAHVIIVTVRLLDFAMHDVIRDLRVIRRHQPTRPVVLALTCLHDAYPQQQHPEPYPFSVDGTVKSDSTVTLPDNLLRSLERQREQFAGLYDYLTPIDLTRPED